MTDAVSDGMAARRAALALLTRVLESGTYVDDAFPSAVRDLEPRDRGFVRQLVMVTLRHLGEVDAVLDRFVDRRPAGNTKIVWTILRLAAAQLLFLQTPAHAVVDTSVRLTVNAKRPRFKGLVNAVLRKVADQGVAALTDIDAARVNVPKWQWEKWVKTYGEDQVRAIAAAHASQPPLDLSVKSDADTWAKTLGGSVLDGTTVRIAEPSGRIEDLAGFADGAWWVQDAAAARPVRLLLETLGDAHGKHVIDLCAAPGGKTAQLCAAGCHVTAVDVSKKRMARVEENLARLKLDADIVVADALTWVSDTPPDAVLVDAPCSATGTVRRHPELPWIKSSAVTHALTKTQSQLLRRACDFVKPGGVVVYAVCSLEPEEGEHHIEKLTADRPELVIETTHRLMPGDPGDGFFVAVLRAPRL